ncbi:ISNCY family transposase [Sulfuriflexus sp.]|uniref:ISNCY family transposase n=1 Tax=Sulfuriflexus sp. TaxID=2015443 RepID=UPI0028CBF99B|nr:ISNCY family transposase [Sulfuriflexus sp.]MDT8405574.1 ISNCY family transposase [Sulfuriflexus sp.]
MTNSGRQELIGVLRERYAQGSRAEKGRILDEFTLISGCHRKSAIRILSGVAELDPQPRKSTRPRVYDDAVHQALIVMWEASDRVCGKRLKALLPILLPALERHGHLQLDSMVHDKLMSMSAATIDRRLRETRLGSLRRHARKKSTAVQRNVAIRTFADWSDPLPGYLEMDLVVHSGERLTGSYLHTLSLTDVASGWTDCAPLLARNGTLVVESVEALRGGLPFLLRGLDVDNGSEFLNEELLRYCAPRGIELTRSRPYHKNDQAWIEQKNGSVVRRLVGYRRLEGMAAFEALSHLYAAARLFINFFQPSFKLKEKVRTGARVVKRYHAPQTPCSRLLASATTPDAIKVRLQHMAETLDPLQLLDQIRTMQQRLATIAAGDKPPSIAHHDDDLTSFLASLSTAWHEGEVRPTHRTNPTASRHWRTRKDPFESVWPKVMDWLEKAPDQSAKSLLERLKREHPGKYFEAHLRTLQRRVKKWRGEMALRLVFGQGNNDVAFPIGDYEGKISDVIRKPPR